MKKSQILALLLACGSAAATLAQNPPAATPPAAPSGAAPKPGNAEPGRPPFPSNRPPRSAFEDSLAPEVKEKYKAIKEEAAAKEKPVRENLRKARTEMDALVKAEKVDEDGIIKKALLIGQNEGELALIRARTNAKYRGLLPAEQAEKLINPFKMYERSATNQPTPVTATPPPQSPQPK